MKCCRCPLYHYWSNESDRGEACAIFGDGWDSPFQYEDKEGTIVGCYLDRHYIEKADAERDGYYASMAESAIRYFEDEPQTKEWQDWKDRMWAEAIVTEPQTGYCNECKWFRNKQVCGRCRSKNLYAPKTEPQSNILLDAMAKAFGIEGEPQIIACPIQEEDADYARWLYETEPQTDIEIARAIVHKAIDDTAIAEDAYPDLRQKMHDAVDNYEPKTEFKDLFKGFDREALILLIENQRERIKELMAKTEPQTDVVALDKATLMDYLINSVDENDEPVWTERHIDEILKDFDVVPKTEPQTDCAWQRGE